MSDHSTAFVPIESWSYNAPSLLVSGQSIDIGLFAEALLYYENVIVNVSNPAQFSDLLRWFISQGKYNDFISLVRDGEIKIYEYSFASAAILKDGEYSIWNLQDEFSMQADTFEQRYLHSADVQSCLEKSRDRAKLYKALRGNVIEVKAEQFSDAIDNARNDIQIPKRNALIVQAFVDELYAFRTLGTPPEVTAEIVANPSGSQKIKWNVDFKWLSKMAGKELNFDSGDPLTANAQSNRILLSASILGCDLYLGSPIGTLVGDKLYESSLRAIKSHSTIESLKETIEFPNIRELVNSGQIGLDTVLDIRKKAVKFRRWLQEESDRDRDAIIAYHNEVAKSAGLRVIGAKSLNVFGVIAGGSFGAVAGGLAGAAVGGAYEAAVAGAAGAVAGDSIKGFLGEISSRLNTEWKPVIFGNWMKSRIKEVLSKGESE